MALYRVLAEWLHRFLCAQDAGNGSAVFIWRALPECVPGVSEAVDRLGWVGQLNSVSKGLVVWMELLLDLKPMSLSVYRRAKVVGGIR